jgi:hypothetical protein
LPKEKSLTKNRYRFCQKRKFSQENIGALLSDKNLAKKKCNFHQKRKVYPRRDIGFARKR